MKNYNGPGESWTVAAPYDLLSGAGALVGTAFGVATHDALNGAIVTLQRLGDVSLAKVSAQAWTVGATIYWDNTAKLATTVATANTSIGFAAAAAANPSATGRVILHGTASPAGAWV